VEQLIGRLTGPPRRDGRRQAFIRLLPRLLDRWVDPVERSCRVRDEWRVAAPVMCQADQLSETLRVQGFRHGVGCLLAPYRQLCVDGRGNRTQDQFSWHLGQQGGLPLREDVEISHPSEQVCPPHELLL
jgi:hypothetical protein